MMSSGISAQLHKQIQGTLLACGPFASQAALSVIFVDSRISAWQSGLPEANSAASRVTGIIDFLLDRYNTEGENTLVLFLQVLSDQLDERDSCHHQLLQLANALKNERENPALQQITPTEKPPAYEKPKRDLHVSIEGDVSGQIALGDHVFQIGEVHGGSVTIRSGKDKPEDMPPTSEENEQPPRTSQ